MAVQHIESSAMPGGLEYFALTRPGKPTRVVVGSFRESRGGWTAVNVRSILNSNQFQIVRRKDFPFCVLHFHSKGLSGAFVKGSNHKNCTARFRNSRSAGSHISIGGVHLTFRLR
jgi:hypothetical protein